MAKRVRPVSLKPLSRPHKIGLITFIVLAGLVIVVGWVLTVGTKITPAFSSIRSGVERARRQYQESVDVTKETEQLKSRAQDVLQSAQELTRP